MAITTIPANDPITPAILNDMFEKVKDLINGGIITSDLQTLSVWVSTLEIAIAEFYGSPSPRVTMPSTEVHYREQFDKTYSFIAVNDAIKVPVPIPALCATIHTPLESEDPSTLLAIVHCNFLCFESFVQRGTGNAPLDTLVTHLEDTEVENTNVLAAYYELYVNGTIQTGTRRDLYWNFGAISTKNHSISALVQLLPGINDISVRVFPKVDTTAQTSRDQRDIKYYQIFTQTRNMIIDVMYR